MSRESCSFHLVVSCEVLSVDKRLNLREGTCPHTQSAVFLSARCFFSLSPFHIPVLSCHFSSSPVFASSVKHNKFSLALSVADFCF